MAPQGFKAARNAPPAKCTVNTKAIFTAKLTSAKPQHKPEVLKWIGCSRAPSSRELAKMPVQCIHIKPHLSREFHPSSTACLFAFLAIFKLSLGTRMQLSCPAREKSKVYGIFISFLSSIGSSIWEKKSDSSTVYPSLFLCWESNLS